MKCLVCAREDLDKHQFLDFDGFVKIVNLLEE